MAYFAHTAEDEGGRRLADESRWQWFKVRLCVIHPAVSSCHLKTVPREVAYGR